MHKQTFGEGVINFYMNVKPPTNLPTGVLGLDPYKNSGVKDAVKAFYMKYFNDSNNRVFLIGINPGRLGAGATGIAFTDTNALNECGIENEIAKTTELSAQFVYKVINKYGGPDKFYKNFFITSICPIGFIKDGVNFNYYDDTSFVKLVLPYIQKTFKKQIALGAKPTAIILGKGKNYKVIEKLNKECGFFEKIIPIEHPRFIMQYRRRHLDEYVDLYQKALNTSLEK